METNDYKRLIDFVVLNPKEKLKKNTVAKKIGMDKLSPYTKQLQGYSLEKYKGGSKFRNGDTLFARITPCLENGKTAQVTILDEDEIGFGSTEFIVLRAMDNLSDSNYVYYLSLSKDFRNIAIKSMVGTSGRQRVQQSVIEQTKFFAPNLPTQKRIASILSTLDDKIELNNKINKNLEEMAQAIFKSWFVDFEPWGGEMPNDWEYGILGDICNCKLGGTPSRNKSEFWGGEISWINSGKVNEFRIIKESEKITELGLQKSSTKLLPRKTIVIAITGATLGQISLLEIQSCANQSVVGIIPNKNIPYEYIFPYLKTNINQLTSHQTGGAQQHINKQNIENFNILVPEKKILLKYQKTVSSLYDKISENCFENNNLINLRDALLPKLMSGELDVSNLEI